MRTENYNQKDTSLGKLSGLILIVALFLVSAISSAQNVITEDFTEYKAAPELIKTTTPSETPAIGSAPMPAPIQRQYPGHTIPETNTNPVKNEVKKELGYIGKLVLGIISTAIIVTVFNKAHGITTD